jgi:predicted RNase H-like HicB family nuclease
MYNVTYTVRPDAEYGFIVTIPEIPGISNDGQTPQEAITNVQEDIALALELIGMSDSELSGFASLEF